jgi:hypothetical protein
VHSLQEGAGPRFGENPLKTTENMGLDPLFAPSFEKVWIRRVQNAGVSTLADEFIPYREEEGVYFEKKYRSQEVVIVNERFLSHQYIFFSQHF